MHKVRENRPRYTNVLAAEETKRSHMKRDRKIWTAGQSAVKQSSEMTEVQQRMLEAIQDLQWSNIGWSGHAKDQLNSNGNNASRKALLPE